MAGLRSRIPCSLCNCLFTQVVIGLVRNNCWREGQGLIWEIIREGGTRLTYSTVGRSSEVYMSTNATL